MVDERDPVDAFHRQAGHRQKTRPGYVITQLDGWSLVALGTGQCHPDRHGVKVGAQERFGRAMRLSKDTWFYAENMQWFRDDELDPRLAARCPIPLFNRLRELFHDALARRIISSRPLG